MLFTDTLERTDPTTGCSDMRQRQPRNAWARMPKGNDSTIHVQSISYNTTCRTRSKSKPRYIQ